MLGLLQFSPLAGREPINEEIPYDFNLKRSGCQQTSDRATFFYLSQVSVPLIYPPQYRTAAAAYTSITLQNGQSFWSDLG